MVLWVWRYVGDSFGIGLIARGKQWKMHEGKRGIHNKTENDAITFLKRDIELTWRATSFENYYCLSFINFFLETYHLLLFSRHSHSLSFKCLYNVKVVPNTKLKKGWHPPQRILGPLHIATQVLELILYLCSQCNATLLHILNVKIKRKLCKKKAILLMINRYTYNVLSALYANIFTQTWTFKLFSRSPHKYQYNMNLLA